jgi:putative tributyrin esterase
VRRETSKWLRSVVGRRATGLTLLFAALVLAAGPALAQRRGAVESDDFESSALGVRKRYAIYLPPSYGTDPRRRYPVAYFLHGATGSEDDWVRDGRLDVVMDSLIAAGMPELIVVMPDGDDGYYTTWAPAYDWRLCPGRPDLREPAGRYCVRRPRYDEYIARDLVRHIDATYRTEPDRRHRAVAGQSMGGFGAMALAAEYPQLWAAAASLAGAVNRLALAADTVAGTAEYAGRPDTLRTLYPSLWPILTAVFGPDTSDWWAREAVGRFRRMKPEERGRLPALYADVGTEDERLVNNRAFRIELTRLGVPLEYHEYPGRHDWPYWRTHLGESLVWLAARIAPRAP